MFATNTFVKKGTNRAAGEGLRNFRKKPSAGACPPEHLRLSADIVL